jgi:hypothetical protein
MAEQSVHPAPKSQATRPDIIISLARVAISCESSQGFVWYETDYPDAGGKPARRIKPEASPVLTLHPAQQRFKRIG